MRRLLVFVLAFSSCVAGPVGRSRWMEVEVPPAAAVTDEFLSAGEKLYGWNCLPCHGAEGRGDGPQAARVGLRPRDFTRGAFRLKSSAAGEMPFDDDLFRTIATGIPIAGMPSFPDLSNDDRWALVHYVKSLAEPGPPARTRIAPPERRGDAARGADLFRNGCAACHGPGGRADGPAAATLGIPLPDFTRGEVAFKAGSRPEDVYRVLTAGMAGTPMPSFASVPERDRRDLAAFVTTLYRPIPPGERLFLESGCVSCHTIGKGRLIGPDLAEVGRRRSRVWLRAWLVDPAGLTATDPEARRLVEQYGSPMQPTRLAPTEIEQVLDFLGSP